MEFGGWKAAHFVSHIPAMLTCPIAEYSYVYGIDFSCADSSVSDSCGFRRQINCKLYKILNNNTPFSAGTPDSPLATN